jgi:hypothetical protein
MINISFFLFYKKYSLRNSDLYELYTNAILFLKAFYYFFLRYH